MARPFGLRCPRPSLDDIKTPAIYSIREVARRTGMTEAQVRKMAQARGVSLHHQNNTEFLRRADINTKMPELHERACRIEGEDA